MRSSPASWRRSRHRFGSYEQAAVRLDAQGNLRPLKSVRGAYAYDASTSASRRAVRTRRWNERELENAADREARRSIGGDGIAHYRNWFAPEDRPRIEALAATYVVDAAALEVMRLRELALVYRAYQAELVRRGALDFGEQIAAVTQLFKVRPNLLRRWQRQFRYLLIDEFQDANIAQIELIEMLGRTPDRPDNVMVVGDDDQSIYRFRGASYAAFEEFTLRFGATRRASRDSLEQNFRSVERVLTAANRLIARQPDPVRAREGALHGARGRRAGPAPDLRRARGRGGRDRRGHQGADGAGGDRREAALVRRRRPVSQAQAPRRHRGRLRDEDIPYTVVGGLSLFGTPEIRDLEQSLRAIADPLNDVALVRMLTAGPWRLDALEILEVSPRAKFDRDAGLRARRRAMRDDEAIAPAMRAKLRRLVGHARGAHAADLARGPVHDPRAVRRADGADPGPHRRRLPRGQAHRHQHRELHALRGGLAGGEPQRSLAGFVDYLDAYQQSGGELPTSVELTEDVEGVRLMTLYQAKGLEFRHVIVPSLVDGEWPVREGGRLLPARTSCARRSRRATSTPRRSAGSCTSR